MSALERRAERIKLSRLVHVDEERLAFVEQVDPAAVRALRETVVDLLHARGGGAFDNLLAASRLVPNPITAMIAQKVFPPMISALVSGKLDGERARSLIGHIRVEYLADMAPHLDPRAVADVITSLPDDVMVAVAVEINRRKDHLSAGRLVGVAPDRVIPKFLAAIPDERDLLAIAFFLEDKSRLDAIVAHVSGDRVARLLLAAEQEQLWPEAMVLTAHLSQAETSRIAAIAADAPEHTLASLLEATQAEGLWATLLPLVGQMADEDLPKVVSTPALGRSEVLASVLEAAAEVDGWATVVRVVAAMDADAQARVGIELPVLTDAQAAALGAAAAALTVDPSQLGPVAARLG